MSWAQKSKANRNRFNERWREWYRKNSERKKAWEQRRLVEIRAWFRELKGTKQCERCGETTIECLQFHHRDPTTKLFDVSDGALRKRTTRERILAEIAKCDVLCANCHLRFHWETRQFNK